MVKPGPGRLFGRVRLNTLCIWSTATMQLQTRHFLFCIKQITCTAYGVLTVCAVSWERFHHSISMYLFWWTCMLGCFAPCEFVSIITQLENTAKKRLMCGLSQ